MTEYTITYYEDKNYNLCPIVFYSNIEDIYQISYS